MGARSAVEPALAAGADAAQPPPPPPLPPHRWAQRCVHARCRPRPGFAIALEGHARIPLPPPVLFELLTHPDNAAILRSLDRCTFRRLLTDDGQGRQTVAVEQETTCHFLFYTGKVRTPLLVEQDAAQLSMSYRVPQAGEREAFDGERGMCGHLAALEGSWRVEADGPCASVLHFTQAVSPRGLPPLLGGAVRSFALGQVRATCEDLYAEALRIQAGRPTLPLSSLAETTLPSRQLSSATVFGAVHSADSMPQELPAEAVPALPPCKLPPCKLPADQADTASVLDRHSASSTTSGSDDGSSAGGSPRSCRSDAASSSSSPFAAASSGSGLGCRSSAAAVVASSAASPASYPLSLQRLLSAASGCLDSCWAAAAAPAAAAPAPASRSKQLASSALPPSNSLILDSCPRWLLAGAAAALCLLRALLRALQAAVQAELRAAEVFAARLSAAVQQE